MFVIEFGFDDMPASFLEAFFSAKKSFVRKKFGGKSRFFVTPRRIIISSESVPENLIEILEEFFRFEWKSMRWSREGHRFIRPLRWIFAMDSRWGLDISFWGVRSSNFTFTHRAVGNRKITVPSADDFFPQLAEGKVIYSQGERRKMIEKQLSEFGVDPSEHPNLVSTAVFSTEYPTAVMCEADSEGVPPLIAKSIIADTLFCFPIGKDKVERFVAICDNPSPSEEVRSGYVFVASSRFDDARFYIEEDRKTPFSQRVHLLENLEFHPKFGSYYERQVMVSKICDVISAESGRGNRANLRKASMLAKADLTTGLYKEFPDFSGYIGMWYALGEGEDEEIAKAIWEHTWRDRLPETETGLVLAVADRIFHLLAGFCLGFEVTSESDPYGLRASARTAIRFMIEGKLDVPMGKVAEFVFPFFVERFVDAWGEDEETVSRKVAEGFEKALRFFDERVEVYLSELGIPKDIVRAVLPVTSSAYDAYLRAKAIFEHIKKREFKQAFWVARRVSNILSQAEAKGFQIPDEVKEFFDDVERKLFDTVNSIAPEFENAIGRKDYSLILDILIRIRPDVDEFFNRVMVLDSDERKRATRLAILGKLKKLLDLFADFSKIEKR